MIRTLPTLSAMDMGNSKISKACSLFPSNILAHLLPVHNREGIQHSLVIGHELHSLRNMRHRSFGQGLAIKRWISASPHP
jgi:hypothetical protein